MCPFTKNIGHLCVAFCGFIILLSSRAGALRGETLFLKDGRVLDGNIVHEDAGTIALRDAKGVTSRYLRRDIIRILFAPFHRGKMYIQSCDGRLFEAFVVDEDADSYIVRDRLDCPEEYAIPREMVLFIARKNPSGLEARVGPRHVDLSWVAPHNPENPPRGYRIYMKSHEGDFTLAAESDDEHCRVDDLARGVEYTAFVTAIDSRGEESVPSGEVRFTTDRVIRKALRMSTAKPLGLRVSGSGVCVLPVGDFNRLYRVGYGGGVSIAAEGFFSPLVVPVARIAAVRLEGADDPAAQSVILSLIAACTHGFALTRWLSLTPEAGFGAACSRARDVKYLTWPISAAKYTIRYSWEPLVAAGIAADILISPSAVITAAAFYHGIIERRAPMNMVAFTLGAGRRF